MATSAPLGDRPVPKMASQGKPKPGGATVRHPEHGHNAQRTSHPGKLAHKSIKTPGSGTRGQSGNRSGNSVPRAS